jgi:cupin superfamily acireductone dioxygenase involved in methionine salvage
MASAKAGDLLRLPEGTYHVVSTYGESNAIARTDLKVETAASRRRCSTTARPP